MYCMPAGYVLTEEQMGMKKAQEKYGAPGFFRTLRPGVDYVHDEFIYLAADEEEARLIAGAYGGELISFSGGIAKARQKKGSAFSLGDLLAASADTENNLPPIELNMMYSISG